MANIYEKLSEIQNELKVPKNIKNNFADFNYRSCEQILELSKPICKKHKTLLLLTDEIQNIGNYNYVTATAMLIDLENPAEQLFTKCSAKEPADAKPKMDTSQTTGSTSSYARKYALNGLFCLDDNKDPDSLDHTVKKSKSSNDGQINKTVETKGKVIPATEQQIEMIKKLYVEKEIKELITISPFFTCTISNSFIVLFLSFSCY